MRIKPKEENPAAPQQAPVQEEQEERKQRRILVLRELPKIDARVLKDDKTGEEFDVITIEEALTRLLNE